MAELNRDAIVIRITEIADRIGQSLGLEIVEVQLLGGGAARTLRIFIDKPEGVTHEDCENISRQVGTVLDEEDVLPGNRYTLEVSSPGVERKLSRPADFERFTGQKAKISLTEPVEDQKYWVGTLRGLQGDTVTLEPTEGKFIQIPLGQVRKANLKFEW